MVKMNIQWVSGARPLPVKRRFGGLFGLSEQEQSCVCGKGEPDECYALGDGDTLEFDIRKEADNSFGL